MKIRFSLLVLGIVLLGLNVPKPPKECSVDYNFAALDPATIKALSGQGSLVIVRQRKDMTLINVTAAKVVNAPPEVVWAVLTDFEHYPKFMPQTTAERVIERQGDKVLIEQTLSIKFWQLPSLDLTYRLAYQLEPMTRIRFWHAAGPMEGTYGGWDILPAGTQTFVFYTLYSNLTSLGWGLGSVMKSQPDFMTGINITTANMVVKAIKEEAERRAKK